MFVEPVMMDKIPLDKFFWGKPKSNLPFCALDAVTAMYHISARQKLNYF
jgi:hypothetical protein